MKNSFKFNFIYYISLGITIGLLISLFFSYVDGAKSYFPSSPEFVNQFSSPLNALLASIIIWGSIGFLSGVAGLVFRVNKWSLLKRTIIHFLATYLDVLLLGIIAGWFPINFINWLIFTIIYLAIYLIVWFINYKRIKHDIYKINQKLKK